MKKALAVILLLTSTTLFAEPAWRNPNAKFDISNNMTTNTNVKLIVADDVQKVCEAESKKRGMGGFGYGVDACSFWDKNACTIVVEKRTSMHMLGHELRHCFQGNYH